MSHRIAIVDDETKIVRFIKANLQSIGYKIETYSDGEQFLNNFELKELDLVLLDIMMPNMDGFTVLKRLRKFSNIPVIILSASSDSNDLVEGFELEADDYLTKTFSLEELFARVKAVLRRTYRMNQSINEDRKITVGNIVINLAQKRVFVNKNDMRFTNTEFMTLEQLALNVERVVSH